MKKNCPECGHELEEMADWPDPWLFCRECLHCEKNTEKKTTYTTNLAIPTPSYTEWTTIDTAQWKDLDKLTRYIKESILDMKNSDKTAINSIIIKEEDDNGK